MLQAGTATGYAVGYAKKWGPDDSTPGGGGLHTECTTVNKGQDRTPRGLELLEPGLVWPCRRRRPWRGRGRAPMSTEFHTDPHASRRQPASGVRGGLGRKGGGRVGPTSSPRLPPGRPRGSLRPALVLHCKVPRHATWPGRQVPSAGETGALRGGLGGGRPRLARPPEARGIDPGGRVSGCCFCPAARGSRCSCTRSRSPRGLA